MKSFHNWAGNYTYSTNQLHKPKDIEQIQALVTQYNNIKVLGTRHSFNGIADCIDHLISLEHLNQIIALDKEKMTVTVEAGIQYGHLSTYLHQAGYALHNMLTDNWLGFINELTTLVNNNEVSIDRINDAVRRILTVKFETGVFEHPYGDRSILESGLIGTDEHRQVAREAVRKSLVLLKNEKQMLPISKDVTRLYVAGAKANDIGLQSGGMDDIVARLSG